jgi:glycosidase
MPVSEFDGNISWGYNPSIHSAADKFYGPREELKRFIDLAHQNGIAVILDVVYNHATGQSPLVRLFNEETFGPPTSDNPWANPSARHPFNVFNDMNHESTFTQYWLDRMNEYWLTEYNVDGFRFDLSKGFTQGPDPDGYTDVGAWSSEDPERIALLQRMADEIWRVDDRAYIILEHFADTSEERKLAEYRVNEGLPGMMLWNNVHGGYNDASMGYANSSSFNNSYYRNRGISVPNYVSYMESHDEQWMMYNNIAFGNASSDGSYDVKDLETALNRQKLVGAFFFTIPGPRMLWQFGELGYGYGDGGEQCLDNGSGNCPSVAPGRTDPKPIRWDYFDPAQSPNRVQLYKAWSAIINLRQQNDVFRATDTDVTIDGNNAPGRRIQLLHPTMDVVIVGNVGVTRQLVPGNFPSNGEWYDFFSGKTIVIDDGEAADNIPLAPGQFHIFTSEPVPSPDAGLVPFDVSAPAPSVPADLSATEDNAAGEVQLTWSESTSVDVTGYRLYRGTTSAFDTTGAAIGSVAAGTTSFTDATASSGQSYVYAVVATDNDGQVSPLSNEATALLYPTELAVDVTRSFGDGSNQQDYQLIGLPGNAASTVQSTFSGAAGDDWQVYWDDGSSDDFLQKFDGSSTFEFAVGRGFWAIATESWSVQTSVPTVDLRSRPDETFITIPIHTGWNIISNPFEKAVDWGVVQAANEVSQPLWRFDGSFRQASVFTSASTGEAFYYNNTQGANILEIPYSSTTGSPAARSKSATDLTHLTAAPAEGRNTGVESRVEVGVSASATNGVDEEDIIAPPRTFEVISLQIQGGDGTVDARQRALKRSIRPEEADGHTYELTLYSEPHSPVRLRSGNLPASAEARLVNRFTGESTDLRASPEITFIPKQASTKLSLLVGTKSFVDREEERLVPDDLTLWPNYPNPFRGSTTIEYTLPTDAHVTLEVYDVLGRRVATLVDDRKRSGLHTLQWDGTGGAGQPLASGIYFGRIIVDGRTATRKMTIIR